MNNETLEAPPPGTPGIDRPHVALGVLQAEREALNVGIQGNLRRLSLAERDVYDLQHHIEQDVIRRDEIDRAISALEGVL